MPRFLLSSFWWRNSTRLWHSSSSWHKDLQKKQCFCKFSYSISISTTSPDGGCRSIFIIRGWRPFTRTRTRAFAASLTSMWPKTGPITSMPWMFTQKGMRFGKSSETIGSHLWRINIHFLKWKGALERMVWRSFSYSNPNWNRDGPKARPVSLPTTF